MTKNEDIVTDDAEEGIYLCALTDNQARAVKAFIGRITFGELQKEGTETVTGLRKIWKDLGEGKKLSKEEKTE